MVEANSQVGSFSPGVYLEGLGQPSQELLVRIIDAAKGSDPLSPITVVVPSNYAALYLRRELGKTGSVNTRLMVLPRLAELLGASLLAEGGQTPLTKLREASAVRRVAIEANEPFQHLHEHPAFHRSLLATFRELRHASPAALEGLAGRDSMRREVVRLFRQFLTATQSEYYDREALAEAAAKALEGGVAAGLNDLGPVIFYMTHDLSPGERVLATALARYWQCAVILGTSGDAVADAPIRSLASEFAADLGLPNGVERKEIEQPHQIIVAPTAREEVRRVLRNTLQAIEGGTSAHRIAILYGNSNPYSSLIREELDFAGLAYAGPESTTLGETLPGRTLVGLLQLVGSELPRDSLMNWLTSCPISPPSASPEPIQPALWDAISKRAGIAGGFENWEKSLIRYGAQCEHSASAAVQRDDVSDVERDLLLKEASEAHELLRFIRGLAGRLTPPTDGSNWAAWADWLTGLLDAYLDREGGAPELVERYVADSEKITETLNELGSLDSIESGPDLELFRLAVEDAMSQPSGHRGKTGTGVLVAPLATASGMTFDLVHILGLIEGAIPPRPHDDALIPDADRQAAGGFPEGLPTRSAREADNRHAYLTAIASAPTRVVSFPRAEDGGSRELFPSRWLLEAASNLYGGHVYSSSLLGLVNEPWITVIRSSEDGLRGAHDVSALGISDRDLHELASWKKDGKGVREHYLAESGTLARGIEAERARNSSEFTVWDGNISAGTGKADSLDISKLGVLSASRVETWATCPMKYFLRSVLGIGALDSPEELLAITPMEKGTVVHSILEGFIERTEEEGSTPEPETPWSEDHRKTLYSVAEEVFEDAQERGVVGRQILWELEKEAIRADLDSFLEQDSILRAKYGVTPKWAELSFGFGTDEEDDSQPAIERDIPGVGVVRFRGSADRVDVSPDGASALVIDYKTGSTFSYKKLSGDLVDAGRKLQLPIYLLAGEQALEPKTRVSAMYWFVSSRGGFEQIPDPPIQLSDVASRFDDVIGKISHGVASGQFPANPGKRGDKGFANCTWCDFSRICQVRRDVQWEKKQADGQLNVYVSLEQSVAGTD